MHTMNLQNGNSQSFQNLFGHRPHFSQCPEISEWETFFKTAYTRTHILNKYITFIL